MQVTFARSWYEKFCLWHDNVLFIKNFFTGPSIYSILWKFLVLACFGSFDIKPVDEFADELLEEFEIFLVSVFLVYAPFAVLLLSDFKRLYDFFLFQGMSDNLIFYCFFNKDYLNSFLLIFWNCFLPKLPSSLNGVL